MPILETALGIERAFEIARASERVVALTLGLEDLTADLGVPVLSGLPSGHTSGGSQTLPLGVTCRVSDSPPSFEITGPAVAPRTSLSAGPLKVRTG